MNIRIGALGAIVCLASSIGLAQFMGSIQFIPAAASAPGGYGTTWRTDLYLYNPMPSDITVWAFFYESGENNLVTLPETVVLPAGQAVTYPDVLQSLFHATGSGAIGLLASEGIISGNPPDTVFLAHSRTYTQGSTGTYGQGIPGSMIPVWNAAAMVDGVRTTGGFRTNIGVFAPLNAQTFHITAEVHDRTGTLVETKDFAMKPFSHLQMAVSAAVEDGWVRFVPDGSTEQQLFFAYASQVDNASGDAVYLPAYASAKTYANSLDELLALMEELFGGSLPGKR